jgi:hypothetical protein
MVRSGASEHRAALDHPEHDYGGSVPASTLPASLRQAVLAVSVLTDIDLCPRDDGVLVTARQSRSGAVLVGQAELAEALGDHDPLSVAGRRRMSVLLRLYRLVADHGERPDGAPALIRRAARALALPPDHAVHPGPGWVLQRLRGDALDLGVGLLGLGEYPDDVQPLPPSLAARLDLRPAEWWPDLGEHVERMGGLTATRIARDGRPVLRPVGGCDVLTLLASASLRTQLSAGDGTGLRAVAAPTRRRGWFDLAQIDPAYTTAAWSITSEPDRGLPSPVLVTRDEVTVPVPAAR